jgi:hypothetical protein
LPLPAGRTPITWPVPTHAAATSCTVPSPPTARTSASSGNPEIIRSACPGPCVTCHSTLNPRSSRYVAMLPRQAAARPLLAAGFNTRCAVRCSPSIARRIPTLKKGRPTPAKHLDQSFTLMRTNVPSLIQTRPLSLPYLTTNIHYLTFLSIQNHASTSFTRRNVAKNLQRISKPSLD